MLEHLFGHVFGKGMQWIGGAIRYCYGTIIRDLRMTKRRRYTFREYVHGPDVPEDVVFDTAGHRFTNAIVGFGAFALLLVVLVNGCG